ncbi:GNAT family N-acetyltransferase [Oceanotoga sp. DSM 15011]|uniref:GNAT family N-acetyltransferase n=1 Tax=Oceanotoga sp. DSM 15011 TaxID=2984951 RepID=UPI0021F3ECE5|nr:GNAT family N-acetyltransferase [Oceanotoga sp. DSM 15011]UYO99347.1 GNAT family N-acetyltransferase [Oceanotoga sp. DSM 15011]
MVKKSLENEKIIKDIHDYWFKKYNIKNYDPEKNETGIFLNKDIKDDTIFLIFLKNKSFIQCNSKIADIIKIKINTENENIRFERLKEIFRDAKIDNHDYYFYSDGAHIKEVNEEFDYRLLTKKDLNILNDMKTYCTKEELEMGFVEIDHEGIMGCFDGEKLVSAGSYIYWGDRIGDIGILTHPEYRKRKIGRSVVSKMCDWGMMNNKIPLYRCNDLNIPSCRLANSLNLVNYMHLYEINI